MSNANSERALANELGIDIEEQRRILASVYASSNRNNDDNKNDVQVLEVRRPERGDATRLSGSLRQSAPPATFGGSLPPELQSFFPDGVLSLERLGIPEWMVPMFGRPIHMTLSPAGRLVTSQPSAAAAASSNISSAIMSPSVAANTTMSSSTAMAADDDSHPDHIVLDGMVAFCGDSEEKALRYAMEFLPKADQYQWITMKARPRGANDPPDAAVGDGDMEIREDFDECNVLDQFAKGVRNDPDRKGAQLIRDMDELAEGGLVDGCGKWLVFSKNVDMLAELFLLTWRRKLGHSIKYGRDPSRGEAGVACVYVNWAGERGSLQNVAEVRCRLRKFGLKLGICFKPDIYTILEYAFDFQTRMIPLSRFGDHTKDSDGEIVAVCACGCSPIKNSAFEKRGTKRNRNSSL